MEVTASLRGLKEAFPGGWDHLPTEIILHIFQYFRTARQILIVGRVSRAWHSVSLLPSLWKGLWENCPCFFVQQPKKRLKIEEEQKHDGGYWRSLFRRKSIIDNCKRPWAKQILKGHQGLIHSVNLTEKFIISGSADQSIKVWDRSSGRCRHTYKHHTSDVTAVDYKANLQLMASCSLDGTVRVYHLKSGTNEVIGKGCGALRCMLIAPRGPMGTLLSAGDRGLIDIYDLATGRETGNLPGHYAEVLCLGMDETSASPILVSGAADRTVKLWDLRLPSSSLPIHQLPLHLNRVVSLAYRNDFLVTCSSSQQPPEVKLWDCRMLHTPTTSTTTTTTKNNTLKRGRGNETAEISGFQESGMRCALSVLMDDERIVVGSYDKKVRIWSAFDPDEATPYEQGCLGAIEFNSPPMCLDTSGSPGSPIAVGCIDHSVCLIQPMQRRSTTSTN